MLAVMSDLTNRRVDLSVLKDRLRERREVLRLDQEALAERAGMSPAYISRLERGAIPNPKVFDLERVATALGTSVGELMHAGSGGDADAGVTLRAYTRTTDTARERTNHLIDELFAATGSQDVLPPSPCDDAADQGQGDSELTA